VLRMDMRSLAHTKLMV